MVNKNDNSSYNISTNRIAKIKLNLFYSLTIVILLKNINSNSLETNKSNEESMIKPYSDLFAQENSINLSSNYSIKKEKTISLRNLNITYSTTEENKTTASNLTDNPYERKLIQKTPINYTLQEKINIQCKNNLILKLLPQTLLDSIYDNLNDFPKQTELKSCKLTESGPYLSCCNENTISLFSDYLRNTIIGTKKNIFADNLFYLSLIQNEHYRNFIEGFGLSAKNFNELFEEFKSFKNQAYNLTEKLVKESIKYTWNSVCNYVCRPDYFNFYNSYNYTFSQNNTFSYGLFFEFFNHESKIGNISLLVSEFSEIQKNFNSKIEEIYVKMINKSKAFNYTNANNQTASLVKKSLEDGKNFFLQMNKELTCDKKLNLTKFECVELIKNENICKPFLCLDNIFVEFIDSTVEPIQYGLNNYNYSNSVYVKNTEARLMNFDEEIIELVNTQIVFTEAYLIKIGFSLGFVFCFLYLI